VAGAGHFGRGPAFHIPALAVIGVGLIGGSLALALKRRGRVGRVIGAGRSRASLEKALRLGAIDAIAAHAAEAAQAADLIFLPAPVGTMIAINLCCGKTRAISHKTGCVG